MKQLTLLLFCISGILSAGSATAQNDPWQAAGKYISRDTVTKKKLTLIFINNDTTFAKLGGSVKQRMEKAFFEVYPKLMKTYNKQAKQTVTFIIDPGYKGVAATSGSVVRYNPGWMLRTPTDIDVVTHEVMHIIQEYGYSAGPVWLTEGIADYVRYKFGVDNIGAGWSLTPFSKKQSYENSYRITARFLVWLEKSEQKDLVKKLDGQLRTHTYNQESWQMLTGHTLNELWAAYSDNPAI